MQLLNKIVDSIFQYLMSRKLSVYKVGLTLVAFGAMFFATGTFDFTTEDFFLKWDNASSIVEYVVGSFLIVSGVVLIFKKNIEDSRIASKKENFLYYISDSELDSEESFKKDFLPEEGRTNLSKVERKINTYKLDDVIDSYNNDRKFEIKPRSKNKHVDNTYIAGLGGFPYLYLMGSNFGSAYASKVSIFDFNRDNQVWYIPNQGGTRIKYRVNFENINVEKKVNELKYNGKDEVGIAISNSFTIEKDSIPVELVNDTLFLILEESLGINNVEGQITQNSLLEQLTNIIGELSNTKSKIHLFVSARASFCINLGSRYMPKTYPTIVLHNYNKDTRKRDWSIELKNGEVTKG
ncbi:SAVED domain-containing protein [Aliarcobacter butzleri]|uniref:SAVED domain-containing protein n=1 Tax=Aliarcobacter butzleri TaxID=28197 RepID=UPI001EDA7C53|nr:SAVED domain-containing protein [Aliarcobacter butzleri]MCG3676216.1 SAVED domain-containing protein [Aliarcobacter butzleri]